MKFAFKTKAISYFLLSILSVFFVEASAQDGYLPYSSGNRADNKSELFKNIELSAGTLLKSGNEAIKANAGIQNIVFKRIGFYTSLEFNSANSEVKNIIGGSVSLFPFIYLWGGMDLVSSGGVFASGFKGARKEVGVGLTPWKWTVLRLGWSGSVGPSLSAGVRIGIGV